MSGFPRYILQRFSDPDAGGSPTHQQPAFNLHADNTNDNADDDVDLRGKSGVLDLQIVKSDGDDAHQYEGELEWALYGVDSSDTPEVYTEPSMRMWAEFKWAHPDGNW